MTQIKEVTEDMRKRLRAPLPSEAVKPHPSKPYLSSIKAIYVIERLNDVFGIGRWQIRTELASPILAESKQGKNNREYQEYTALMKTVFTIPEYGIYHECIAGSTNDDEGDSAKGGTTDGITKICSYLEIGIDVFKGKATAPTSAQPQSNGHAPEVELPWLGDKQFKDSMTRISAGEVELLDKLKGAFRIKKDYREQLEQVAEAHKVKV